MHIKIPQKVFALWEIRALVCFIALWGIASYFVGITKTVSIVFGVLFIICALLIPFYLRSFLIIADEDSIEVKCGIIIKINHIMPMPRLIYGETITTPIASSLGVCAVLLKAARGWVIIPEIEREKAEKILKRISGKEKE